MLTALIKIIILISAFSLTLAGQELERLSISFSENGSNLDFPLTGGLNSPQFSAVDLNNDGLSDLHIFDRVGNRQLTFLNDGSSGDFPYTFAPEYVEAFPDITNWMLLRDYNADGVMDIFAYADLNFDAVMVFRGFYQDDRIQFERYQFEAANNVIYVPRAGGGSAQLYVSMIDYPAVDDVDCDGDLDILTFNLVGGYVEFYANQAVESGLGLETLSFRLRDDCWGGFFESGVSNAVDLSENAGDCVDLLLNGELETRHSGSTLLTFDADGDQDKELILGDISFNQLNFLQNGGSCDQTWMTAQDRNFPSKNVPADVPVFPAAFHLDVDQDGRRDLLVAPNASLNAADRSIWWYQNTGTEIKPEFQLVQTDFLVDQMIDLGSGARPVFFDQNADGRLDLVLANYSFYEAFGAKNARLFLYRNTGSASEPAFQLVDDDYLNLNQFSQSAYAFTPAFGDLDGDGDSDAVVGEQNGLLFYLENTAGPGQAPAFGPAQYGYMGIDVGQASVPQIVDLDGDGLPDLVIGERNGNINYFRNQGTFTSPFFATEPDQMILGGVDTRIFGFTTGYSSPFLFQENGQWQLLTGTETGRLEWYNGINENLGGTFSLITETFGALQEGTRTHPALADINNDGLLELAVGNFSGGLTIFRTDLKAMGTVPVRERPLQRNDLRIWPNPAHDRVLLQLEGEPTEGVLRIFNAQGQKWQEQSWTGLRHQLTVSAWPSGVYWLRLEDDRSVRTLRLVVP